MIAFSPIRMMAMGYYAARAAGTGAKHEEGARMGHFMTRLATVGGPFYVKMGQILSTRSDLLPPGAIRALQTLQDNVPPDSFADARAQIERSYGKPIHEVFARFEETPVASASIAQVHRATLRSGEEVAVKIRRKNVKRQMMRSLRFMSGMTGLMSRVAPAMRRMHAKERMAEFRRLLADQLDFRIELHNLEQLRRNFLKHEYIATPKPYPELCNDAVLVMEFVEGVRALDYERIDVSPKVMAARLQNAVYTMLYFDGVCHGDPHPGNMIFSKDGRITFIDFGIVAYLTEDEKWGLSSFYYAATSHQWELAVRRFTKCFVLSDTDLMEKAAYRDRLAAVLKHHFQDQADNWNTMAFFQDVSRVVNDFGATYTPNFTKAELAMMSCEGFAKQMDPHLDIWENARNFSDQYSPFVSDGIRDYLDAWYSEKAPKAMALRDRAKKSLIASTHLDRYFFPSNYPLFVERGYGSHVIDVDAFPGADLAVFSNSGTESVIHALRLCRTYRPKAKLIVKCEGHYHGFSDQAMVSSWFRVKGETWDPQPVAGCQGTPQHVVDSTRVVQFNHSHSLDVIRKNAGDIAAVLLEPMQAGAGQIEVDYLRALRALCTELDIPFVFDEVVTGFRVAYGGVQTLAGVEPDVTCLGKIIGGGLPAGAIVGKRHILEKGRTTGDPFRDYEERAFLGGTMSGNYQSCSAGLAVLNHLKAHPEIYEGLARKTDYLRDRFRSAADARAVNMYLKASHSMFGISFTHKTPKHFREAMQGANFKATLALAYLMRSRGVYMPELHGFLISDAHSMDDLAQVGDAFEGCLDQMDGLGMFVR